ncbi:MAG: IclR family transcriptional regulator [Pseudomonadota bacterium]
MTENNSAPTSPKESGYQAPAVRKAFALLRAVADARTPQGLSELAQSLCLSKGTTHGLVGALLAEGALEHDLEGKKLLLGPVLADLSLKRWNYFRIAATVQPLLNDLRDRIGETVFLGVMSCSKGVIVATAEAEKPFKISSPPGTVIPLLAGAVGKVFLARMDDARAREQLRRTGLPRSTPRSVTDENAYLRELESVRKNGYALDDEEYLAGVKAVAVSLDNRSALPMAVWVVGFSAGLDAPKTAHIIAETRTSAKHLRAVVDRDL